MPRALPVFLMSVLCLLFTADLQKPVFSNSITENPLPNQITFGRLFENSDIALGEVKAIFQDSYGFIWLGGANKLARYDGREFKVVDLQVGGERVQIRNTLCFFEDDHRRIWIGTRSGIVRYSPFTESTVRLVDEPTTRVPLSNSRISKIAELNDGRIAAASDSGLFLIDMNTDRHSLTQGEPGSAGKMQSIHVRTLLVETNQLVLGTDVGIELLDIENMKFTTIPVVPSDSTNTNLNSVTDIIPADTVEHHYWVSTQSGFSYVGKNGLRRRFVHNPEEPDSLASDDIWNLTRDRHERIWIATDGGGISVFDPVRETFLSGINNRFAIVLTVF